MGANKGQIVWNKGLRGKGTSMFGKHHSKETIRKMKATHKRNWIDPEFRSRRTKEIQENTRVQG